MSFDEKHFIMDCHTCSSCRYYRQMGGKSFCYKHNKVVDTPGSCQDYVIKGGAAEHEKRFILQGSSKEGVGIEGTGEITITEKPEGSPGFELPKKDDRRGKMFIDVSSDEKNFQQLTDDKPEQSERLFLAVLGVGLLMLIIILMSSGAF